MEGWIKLHRQLADNDLWLSEPFTKAQAWIDLILHANHKDGLMNIRGNMIKIKRGQIGWSELTMAKRWTWSKNKVRRYLKWLETEQQVTQQKLFKITTILTILNYNKYQSDTTDDTTERQQKDNRRYTNKNVKNEKNVKKVLSLDSDWKNKMFSSKDKRMNIIAFYWTVKGINPTNREQYDSALRRELRPAGFLKGYDKERIKEVVKWLDENADFKWTLETVHKYIDDDLKKIESKGLSEDELINKILKR